MRVKQAVKIANPKDHEGHHICVDGRHYNGSCLVTDKDWQVDVWGEVVSR